MLNRNQAVLLVVVGAALSGAGSAAAGLLPGRLGLFTAGALVCLPVFTLWPYTILPAGIVGGTVAAGAVSGGRVILVVAIHGAILATGCLALAIRRALWPGTAVRAQRTDADAAMLTLAVLLLAAALYGLARGNAYHPVVVAAYEFAVIPAYFFLATHTLCDPSAQSRAELCYLAGAAALAAAQLTEPGRHGGLLSALALPPLLVAAGRARGWRRAGLAVLIATTGLDIVLAAYRSIWMATAVALVFMLLRGTPRLRGTVLAVVAAGAALVPLAVAAVPALRERAALVGGELGQSSGYRLPEAAIGLRVFADHPFTGAGLGQSTPGVYLPDFAVTTVGPTYHVFYVMVLANLGLAGLLVFLRPLVRAVLAGVTTRDDRTVAFTALTCGFIAAAAFAGPTDGHWELGLLPALTLMTHRRAASPVRVPSTDRS